MYSLLVYVTLILGNFEGRSYSSVSVGSSSMVRPEKVGALPESDSALLLVFEKRDEASKVREIRTAAFAQ